MGYLFTLGMPLVGLLVVAGWLESLWAPPSKHLAYETQAIGKGEIRKLVSSSGPVVALVTVSVGSQLSGLIDNVLVDFNSTVKPGDLLLTIDAKTFKAKVDQAAADLEVANAALVNQRAVLAKAEAIVRLAEVSVTRQKSLAAKGFAAQAALDTANRDFEVANADLNIAKSQIETAEAIIVQRKAALRQAQIDLDRTEIRAPIDGTVILRNVDPGQTVAASLQAPELFKIAQDLSRIRIEAQVNEADVGALDEGNSVTFTVDAYPERQFTGQVTQVRLASTEINSVVTYPVIIEAANEDRKLFPGMTANVQIEAAKREGVLRIPNDAFRYKPKADELVAPGSETDGGDRQSRTVERLTAELTLSPEQQKALRKALAELAAEAQAAGQGRIGSAPVDPAVSRQRLSGLIERTLVPLLSESQKAAFDKWKGNRETVQVATVWVLNAAGQPERHVVRTGLSDDRYTEIVGGDLKEGDAVIIRTREAAS